MRELDICRMATVPVEELREHADSTIELIDLISQKALGHIILWQLDEAEQCLAVADAEAAASEIPSARASALVPRAHLHLRRGELDAAATTLAELRRMVEADLPEHFPIVEHLEGKLERARNLAKR
jgi:hypothetical protein